MNNLTVSLKGKVTAENVRRIKADLHQSIQKSDRVSICCKEVHKTDLAGFNALIMAHMAAIRANKSLNYVNCSESKLVDFISQTQFDHVFIS